MKTKKIVKPVGYQRFLRRGIVSRIFGVGCEIETYLCDETLSAESAPFAVFYGNISKDKIRRIAAILNEDA